jgi:hypothetical protein
MTYSADLTATGRVSSVGYLAREHSFTTGTTSEAFFDRLVAMVEKPLGAWCGYHTCDLGLCRLQQPQEHPQIRYKGRVIGIGSTDIFVPGDEVVYMAPSLILHYIRDHQYLPPSCFVEAVLNCPEPLSQEYCAAIKRIAPEMIPGFGIQ